MQVASYKITPWLDAEEFEEVGKRLLSSVAIIDFNQFLLSRKNQHQSEGERPPEINLIRQALQQVIVWRTRPSGTQLTYPVETTASLTEILLRDYDAFHVVTCSNTSKTSSAMELRLAYSSAIIRGVNGIAGSLQQRRGLDRANALSVATLCKRLGLPGWVVDLRHDAAHGELPTLPSLRMAAKTLLEFFSTLYWKPHSEARRVAKEQALELLLRYKTLSEEMSMESITASHMSIATTQNSQSICANNFVSLVSMDIGIPLAVAALVDGIDSSTTKNNGFLIPSSVENFTETDAGFAKIRKRYEKLVVTTQQSWPGFLHALIVSAVDSIIQVSLQQNKEWSRTSPYDDSAVNVTARRKQFFLSSWVCYVMSRQFLSCLDNSADESGRPTGLAQSNNANNDRNCPSSGNVSWDVLKSLNIPLNSLCDRLSSIEFHKDCEEINRLLSFFHSILGKERVENESCLVALTVKSSRKRTLSQPQHTIFPAEKRFFAGLISKEKKAAVSIVQPASLEEMEAMLSLSDEEEKSASSELSCGHDQELCKGAEEEERKISSPWSRCQSWDSCAIGSIPGELPRRKGFSNV